MKKTIAITLSLLLMLTMSVAANADNETKQAQTSAHIAFQAVPVYFEPNPEFDDGAMRNMDIDFGVQFLPAGAVNYTADDGPHTLRIIEAGNEGGEWQVQVKMGVFESEASVSPFEGKIKLGNGTVSSNIAGAAAELEIFSNNIIISDSPMMVLDATDVELDRAIYDVTWPKEAVKVILDDANALLTQEEQYTAKLTWILTIY